VTERIAVIGDVHGNSPALSAAFDAAAEADVLVLLGDLLSYGPDVESILTQVESTISSREVVLIRGNHDQHYHDVEHGPLAVDGLPEWIYESTRFVAAQVDVPRLRRLPWRDEHVAGSILFAHANPFGLGDWTYLNSADEHLRAVEALRQRGLGLGVFGHTHRARAFHARGGVYRLDRPPQDLRADWDGLREAPWVLNAGAVGQPREEDTTAYVLWLDVDGAGCSTRFRALEYDVDAHLDALRRAPLSASTRQRLLAFHHAA
jgi:predicted phosphodiesterase